MKNHLKTMVAGAYQTQKLRIQTGNRITGNFKVKIGQAPGTSEKDLEKQMKDILDKIRNDYKIITDGITNFPTNKKFKATGVIDSYTELCMLEQYFDLEKAEENQFKRIKTVLSNFPIWTEYLEKVYGIGPALGGVIISQIDIEKATYPSALWRLAGLDVAWDNKGRSKRKNHLVQKEYIDKTGKVAMKASITFKPLLKTKLMGVLASSFLRCGEKSPYTKMYYSYKNRLENHPEHRDNFIALNIVKCKEVLGKIPKQIYTRKYVTNFYTLCENRIRESIVDLLDNPNYESILQFETKALLKEELKSYEILEDLVQKGLVLVSDYDQANFYYTEELEMLVKSTGGVLRKPVEVETFVEGDDLGPNENGIVTYEEFDDAPDKKNRILYKLVNIGKTKPHRHTMACRYMVKRFLVDLYNEWRALEGLPVMTEYAIEKLGIIHGEASDGKGKVAA